MGGCDGGEKLVEVGGEGIDGRFMDKVCLYNDYFFMVGWGGGEGEVSVVASY